MVRTRSKAQKTVQTLQECVCCYESKHAIDFPEQPPTAACEHNVETCSDCLQKWWSGSIDNHYWTVFGCPNCPEQLLGAEEFTRSNMLENTVDRCNYLHDRIRRARNPNYRFCVQPGCNSGQVSHATDTDQCSACNKLNCVPCGAPFHYHCASHEIYQETIHSRKEENRLSVAYIASMKMSGDIVASPNCACLIESYGHVTKAQCTQCLHIFLWRDAFAVMRWESNGAAQGGGSASKQGVRGGVSVDEERHVVYFEEEASYRLIEPLSTKLGPELPGRPSGTRGEWQKAV